MSVCVCNCVCVRMCVRVYVRARQEERVGVCMSMCGDGLSKLKCSIYFLGPVS